MSIGLKDEWIEKAEEAIQNAFWDDANSRDIARAALLAIREPTERMIEGASKATALQECPGCQWPNDWADGEVETFRYRSVFAIRAAIDAALGEDKG